MENCQPLLFVLCFFVYLFFVFIWHMKLEFLLMLFDCCPFSGHSQEESKSSPCTPTHKCGRPQLHHTLLPSLLQAEQPQLFIGHLLQPHHPPLAPPLDFIGISTGFYCHLLYQRSPKCTQCSRPCREVDIRERTAFLLATWAQPAGWLNSSKLSPFRAVPRPFSAKLLFT